MCILYKKALLSKKRMLKCFLCLLFVLAFAAVPVLSVTAITSSEEMRYSSLEELENKKIGVLTGSIFDKIAEENVKNCKVKYFNSNADMASALERDLIDAYFTDEPIACYCINQYNGHGMIAQITTDKYAYFLKKGSPESELLCKKINAFLEESQKNGLLEKMKTKWMGPDAQNATVDFSSAKAGENGILKFATSTDTGVPFAFVKDGNYVGYDIDLAVEFCKANGYGLEIQNYSFSALLNTVQSGFADFAASCVTVTEERAQNVLFTQANYVGGIVVVGKKAVTSAQTEQEGFFGSVLSSVKKTFVIENRWQLFLKGIGNTMLITVCSLLFGFALGFGSFLLCRNGNKAADIAANICFGIVQRLPAVVLLMILYYIILGKVFSDGVVVSVVCFSLTFAASVFKIVKTGVGAVGREQYEAGFALGFSDIGIFMKIILPQAAQHILPLLRSEVITHIKATAIVGYIAVSDLTRICDVIRSRTYEAFFPLIATALIYFVLEGILVFAVRKIEFGLNTKKRKPEKILKGIQTK